jgi:hypothetical protein
MRQRQIEELAAILINEHGREALSLARRRQAQHADNPRSGLFRVWRSIGRAAERLLRQRSG